jgi:hypothetical protein
MNSSVNIFLRGKHLSCLHNYTIRTRIIELETLTSEIAILGAVWVGNSDSGHHYDRNPTRLLRIAIVYVFGVDPVTFYAFLHHI